MTDSSSIERLAALTTLASVPRAQLEWLAAHGEIRRFGAGELMFSKGHSHPSLYIVLSGRFSIRVERGGVARIVKEWKTGAISGRLPYSRMTSPPGDVIADDPVELLMIADDCIRDMTCVCYEFTALCVHEMLDRARLFKSDDLQREKMASLGKLSAGLAHELNNPSSAVVRSAKEMDACRVEVVTASLHLGAAGLTSHQFAALTALEATAANAPKEAHSPLARGDREDALGQWFDDHGVDVGLAEPLANTAVTVADLDAVAAALTAPQLAVALRYVAANVNTGRLTREIENAADRIHALVAATKRHTHMDRAPVVEAVQIEGNLGDTFTLLGSKARAKAVTLELSVEPDLPAVQGVVGELNQVWLNLLDNAIDAAQESGHVTVAAGRERDSVVVKVIDDGAGIGEADRDRIFEPFYTTKAVGQGTGLGLDIVQGVVRSHKGTIDVHSRPGRTEFRVCLPVAGLSR